MITTIPRAAQRGASTYFSALIDKPQRSLVAAAVLDKDENDRNHRNHRNRGAKHVKQYFGSPNTRGLSTQFSRQKPVDRPHEPHQQSDHQCVDMYYLRDVERQNSEQKI